jgi:hypothetical protein
MLVMSPGVSMSISPLASSPHSHVQSAVRGCVAAMWVSRCGMSITRGDNVGDRLVADDHGRLSSRPRDLRVIQAETQCGEHEADSRECQ